MSGPVFVAPHATWSLRPMTTNGMPGNVAPITFVVGVDTCARYQIDGAVSDRCGSFASSGLPDAVRAPDTTQSFEPMPSAAGSAERASSVSARVDNAAASTFSCRYSAG